MHPDSWKRRAKESGACAERSLQRCPRARCCRSIPAWTPSSDRGGGGSSLLGHDPGVVSSNLQLLAFPPLVSSDEVSFL